KNPSRIAAYNRIIKGKRGGGRDEDDGEVVLTLATPATSRRPARTMCSSASAPTLLQGKEKTSLQTTDHTLKEKGVKSLQPTDHRLSAPPSRGVVTFNTCAGADPQAASGRLTEPFSTRKNAAELRTVQGESKNAVELRTVQNESKNAVELRTVQIESRRGKSRGWSVGSGGAVAEG
ncbi:unnamed protein product, partial [Laminaria digitata]